jgi:hypothetical protein
MRAERLPDRSPAPPRGATAIPRLPAVQKQSPSGAESLELALDVFRANFRDLNLMLHLFAEPEYVFQVRELGRFADEDVPFLTQLTQRLHNHLSSLATLIDHTRNVMRGADIDSATRSAYEEQVKHDFAKSPWAGFLKDLRSYMLHYRLPATVGRWDETGPGAESISNSDVVLHLETMRDWPKWSERARAFVDSQGPVARLLPLVSRYSDQVFKLLWLAPGRTPQGGNAWGIAADTTPARLVGRCSRWTLPSRPWTIVASLVGRRRALALSRASVA